MKTRSCHLLTSINEKIEKKGASPQFLPSPLPTLTRDPVKLWFPKARGKPSIFQR